MNTTGRGQNNLARGKSLAESADQTTKKKILVRKSHDYGMQEQTGVYSLLSVKKLLWRHPKTANWLQPLPTFSPLLCVSNIKEIQKCCSERPLKAYRRASADMIHNRM
jgi:hypothetical protein